MPGYANMTFLPSDVGVYGFLNGLKTVADTNIESARTAADDLVLEADPNATPITPQSVTLLTSTTTSSIATVADPVEPTFKASTVSPPRRLSLTLNSVTPPVLQTIVPVAPTLNIPIAPIVTVGEAPTRNFNVKTNVTIPKFKGYTLPKVPTIKSLALPVITSAPLILPYLMHVPTFDKGDLPSSRLGLAPAKYTSDLVVAIRAALLKRLNGGTGLSSIIELAIWNRAKDREYYSSKLAEDTLLNTRAGSGFSRPTGSMLSALDAMVQESQSKMIELSREIAINQAEREQKNLDSTISQILSLESDLLKEHENFTRLSFDLAKARKDVEIELFKASAAVYSTEVEMYRAYTAAYESRIKTELVKLDIHRAKLESIKVVQEVNNQEIALYTASVNAVNASVDIYKAEVQAISEGLKVEALKFDIFKADLESYNAKLEANKLTFSTYSEQIKGELAKTEIYDTQVKSYATRIQAYSSESEVAMKIAELNGNLEGLKIKQYEADIDLYAKQLQADQLKYQAAVDVYKGQADVYSAKVGLNRAAAEVDLKNIENVISQNKATADVAIENAKLKLSAASFSANSLIEGRKAAGSIYQAIGSSALAAMNVSSSFQAQISTSASENHSYDGV